MLKIKLIMMLSIKYMFYYLNLDICNIVINIYMYVVVKSILYKCICSKFIIVRLKCRLGLFFVIGFFFCKIKNVELMVLKIRIIIFVLLIYS